MIEGTWKSNNVKINQLNYETGELRQDLFNLELHILSKVNNQYICRLVFHNNIKKNESGHEFLFLNFNEKKKELSGIDSNSYLTGYLENNKLHFISTGFDHIKFPKNKFMTSYNTIFEKKN